MKIIDNPILQQKYDKLISILTQNNQIAIAYSGGVDSTLLAAVAYDVLGDEAIAISVISEFTSSDELKDIEEYTKIIGIKLHKINISVLDEPNVVSNPQNRCYHCKKAVFNNIKSVAKSYGVQWVADGSNVDDQGDYRPGMQALKELDIQSPLLQAGLTKSEIRELSALYNLPTATKPSAACLATRIPYDTTITKETLLRVEQAEGYMRLLGFENFRVRDYGFWARIELPKEEFKKLLDSKLYEDINNKLSAYGYNYVTLDLNGLVSGSMNINLQTGG